MAAIKRLLIRNLDTRRIAAIGLSPFPFMPAASPSHSAMMSLYAIINCAYCESNK
jgi:hypothetical protein